MANEMSPSRSLHAQADSFENTWPLGQSTVQSNEGARTEAPSALALGSYHLLAQAHRLSTGHVTERQLTVILGMTACELYTEYALTTLLREKSPPAPSMFLDLIGPPMTLARSQIQVIYAWLTDDHPWGNGNLNLPPAPWWRDWIASSVLRENVSRVSAPVSAAAAALCYKSSVSYLAHMADMVLRSTSA